MSSMTCMDAEARPAEAAAVAELARLLEVVGEIERLQAEAVALPGAGGITRTGWSPSAGPATGGCTASAGDCTSTPQPGSSPAGVE